MKWIKYKILCNENEEIFIDKKVGYNDKNLAIAINEAYEGKYEIIEDSEAFKKEPLPVELGGTGVSTVEDILKLLGLENLGGSGSGNTRIEKGHYIGTGKHGQNTSVEKNNQNELFFDFYPLIVIVYADGVNSELLILTRHSEYNVSDENKQAGYYFNFNGNGVTPIDVTSGIHRKFYNKQVQWYSVLASGENADANMFYQMNVSGAKYHYIAIGIN